MSDTSNPIGPDIENPMGSSLDRLSAYDYHLPQELIAQQPCDQRDHSRLMRILRKERRLSHHRFSDLPGFLNSNDLLIVNDTRVIPARLIGRKPSGGEVEIFLSRQLGPFEWEALVRLASGRPKPDMRIDLDDGALQLVEMLSPGLWRIRFSDTDDPDGLIERIGGIPLPPYIHRDDIHAQREHDRKRYQTVYAREPGAVAAPTAGLHFTQDVFDRLDQRGVRRASVTLHVGLGTFQPVREEDLNKIELHEEAYTLPPETLAAIEATRERGGRVVAVGTTTVRVLEHCAQTGRWRSHSGSTRLFLRPGSRFDVVDVLITNYHLPRSTLLMLVAAFAGKDLIDEAYRTAVEKKYRFFSYGDSMLIE